MKTLTDNEYLDLIQKLSDCQYDEEYDDIDMNYEVYEAKSAVKKFIPNTNGFINLTEIASDKIKDAIFKYANLQIGDFKICITKYNGEPGQEGATITTNIEIFETRYKTPAGYQCKIDYPVVFEKDKRFTTKSWIKYFNTNFGDNIPIDTVVDIIRWLQAITKYPAFL